MYFPINTHCSLCIVLKTFYTCYVGFSWLEWMEILKIVYFFVKFYFLSQCWSRFNDVIVSNHMNVFHLVLCPHYSVAVPRFQLFIIIWSLSVNHFHGPLPYILSLLLDCHHSWQFEECHHSFLWSMDHFPSTSELVLGSLLDGDAPWSMDHFMQIPRLESTS